MALIETEGLILKSFNLADADKIVIFLTNTQGLVRGVAKGAKRLKSKFSGSLEPFSVVNLNYFQKDQRELVSVNQIDLIKSYFKNASDIEFLEKFSYLADLLIEFAPPHDPNERLYNMSKICLEAAVENPKNLDAITLYFELWILRLGGYLPSWTVCGNCRNEISEIETANLQMDFQLFCETCSNHQRKFTVNLVQRQIFAFAQKTSPQKFVNFAENLPEDIRDISEILKRIISNVLGKDIRANRKASAKT